MNSMCVLPTEYSKPRSSMQQYDKVQGSQMGQIAHRHFIGQIDGPRALICHGTIGVLRASTADTAQGGTIRVMAVT